MVLRFFIVILFSQAYELNVANALNFLKPVHSTLKNQESENRLNPTLRYNLFEDDFFKLLFIQVNKFAPKICPIQNLRHVPVKRDQNHQESLTMPQEA